MSRLRRAAVFGIAACLVAAPGITVTAAATDTDPLDELHILAVRDDQPTDVLFAAPARLIAETLTADDVIASVDGDPQPIRLQRLSATDLEVAVVVDTTLAADAVRDIQAAIVELALDLPQGATMRIIDSEARVSGSVAVPGPAIAAVRQLGAQTGGDLQQAVERGLAVLDDSTQDRGALLVIGEDLGGRLSAIDDQPFTRAIYLIDIGAGAAADALLGPQASGTTLGADDSAAALIATGDVSQDLRNTYVAEVRVADPDARALTIAIPPAGDGAVSTVALDPGTVRPTETRGSDGEGAAAAPATDDSRGVTARDVLGPAAIAALTLLLLAVAWPLTRRVSALLRARRARRTQPALEAVPPRKPVPRATSADEDPDVASPRRTRPRVPYTRPIAKLSTSTRTALAQAHLGLRQLALASRTAVDSIPDDLFRMAEARASVALSRQDVDLDEVLVAAMNDDDTDADVALVLRTATALTTGWQHTGRQASAPPPVLEINAVLRGSTPNGSVPGSGRPVAPVRALNPLVEIGLEHIVLAGQPDRDSDLVARAVTTVGIMRAARLGQPVLSLSPWLLTESPRYHEALDADLGDPAERDAWLELMCSCVARAATGCADRLTRLGRLRSRYRDRVSDPRLLPLIDLLLSRPIVSVDLVTQQLSTSPDTASRLLSTLAASEWLRPHDRRPDTWVAEQIVSLFIDPSEEPQRTSQPA